jgi:hypothetical protein
MHSHRWEQRSPDWTAAIVSGFAAGAVLMVLDLLWSAMTGVSPWLTSYRIAAIVMGPEVLQSSDFDLWIVAAALVVHYVLGIIFGMVMAAFIAPFRFDSSTGMALLVGAVFGFVLYLLNFYGMVFFFPWFADMRSWATLVAHLIFGMVTAYMYLKLEWPGSVASSTKA